MFWRQYVTFLFRRKTVVVRTNRDDERRYFWILLPSKIWSRNSARAVINVSLYSNASTTNWNDTECVIDAKRLPWKPLSNSSIMGAAALVQTFTFFGFLGHDCAYLQLRLQVRQSLCLVLTIPPTPFPTDVPTPPSRASIVAIGV